MEDKKVRKWRWLFVILTKDSEAIIQSDQDDILLKHVGWPILSSSSKIIETPMYPHNYRELLLLLSIYLCNN